VIPEDLRYTDAHEWVRDLGEGVVRVGITDHAQSQLGDVVFVQLPAVGDAVSAGGAVGEVESTKSVSDIFAPVSGTVVAVNEALADAPELVNSGPYDDGWMVEVRLADPADGAGAPLDDLLDPAAYRQLVES
jgi:glycine cleavage system H protein